MPLIYRVMQLISLSGPLINRESQKTLCWDNHFQVPQNIHSATCYGEVLRSSAERSSDETGRRNEAYETSLRIGLGTLDFHDVSLLFSLI